MEMIEVIQVGNNDLKYHAILIKEMPQFFPDIPLVHTMEFMLRIIKLIN